MSDLLFPPAAFPKPPKKKKRKKTNYREQADVLFARAVRGIGFCEECGSIENLQCAHVISRSYSRVRVDFRNAVCLCRGCHMFFTPRPIEWGDWATMRLGGVLFEELRTLALRGPEIDWKAEVERLRTDIPDYRPDPLGLFRKAGTKL